MKTKRLKGYPLPDATGSAEGYERATCKDLERMGYAALMSERGELYRALREWDADKERRPWIRAGFVPVGLRAVPADEWARQRAGLIDGRLSRGRAA